MSTTRSLYGGAITAQARPDLIDASDLRQVPDNQEVFLYPDSAVSIIVEILQKVEPTKLEDAIKFHFDSLAHDNSSQSSTVEYVVSNATNHDPSVSAPIVIKGAQHIPKFNRSVTDQVTIYMALFRIETKGIDLVVTFNVPTQSQDGGAVQVDGQQRAEADFKVFVESLRIVDDRLFA